MSGNNVTRCVAEPQRRRRGSAPNSAVSQHMRDNALWRSSWTYPTLVESVLLRFFRLSFEA
jgi:hypothetical protein